MAETKVRGLSIALAIAILLPGRALLAQQPDPTVSLGKARELVAAGRVEEAISIYQELARAFPTNPSLLANLAIAQYKAGKYADAAGSCEAALRIQPGSFPALLFLGASRLELGDAAGAVEPLKQASIAQPGDQNARLMLADALLGSGDPSDAAAAYEAAVSAIHDSHRAWYGVARAYDALAEEAFRRVSVTAPSSAYDLALAGAFESARAQYAHAFRLFRQALAIDPALPGVHDEIADIYEKTGHPDWAATERKNARGVAAPDCAAHASTCEYLRGRYAEIAAKPASTPEEYYWKSRASTQLARQAYAKLRALPPSPESHEADAVEHEGRGEYREAAAEWKAALDSEQASGRVRRRYVIALHNANDPSALPALREAVARDPNSAELNFLYGSALVHVQETGEAVPYLERAVKLDGHSRPARAALGEAYLHLGKPDAAIALLESSLPEDNDGTQHYQLAQAYRAVGRRGDAVAALKKSTDLRRKAEEQSASPAITPP